MSIITLKRSDIGNWRAIQPPGYYLFEITEVEKPYSNKNDNLIHKTHLQVIADLEGDKSNEGIEVLLYLNQAGSFVILNLVAAAEGIPPEELFTDGDEQDIELENLVGKRVWADVTHHTYEGKLQNDLESFLPEDHFKSSSIEGPSEPPVSEPLGIDPEKDSMPPDDDVPF